MLILSVAHRIKPKKNQKSNANSYSVFSVLKKLLVNLFSSTNEPVGIAMKEYLKKTQTVTQ